MTMSTDPTRLGTVRDVKGVTVGVQLHGDTLPGVVFVKGQAYRIGQVGSFVRIPLGYTDLFGIVSQVGAGAVPESSLAEKPFGDRWMTVELVGEGRHNRSFERGVSQHPTIGDDVHLVTEAGLSQIYGRPDEPPFVRVGTLASAESIPALLDANKLVTRHSAVVGSTGSGKSTTVAGLLSALTNQVEYPSARVLLLDLHGEYGQAFGDNATVFRVNPDVGRGEKPFYLPYWAMTFDELLPFILGDLNETDRAQILEFVTEMKRAFLETKPLTGVNVETVNVDSPVPFSIHQFWYELHCLVNSTHTAQSTSQSRDTWALELDAAGNEQLGDAMLAVPPRFRGIRNKNADQDKVYLSGSSLTVRRQLAALASKLRDPRFDFLFRPGPWTPNLSGEPKQDLDRLVEEWIGGSKSIAILDLSGVPPSILVELVGALLRILYDVLFWARNLAEGGRERPLLVVMEEAHTYLGAGQTGGAASAVRRIVKEGRKYGIGAMVVSQRPSEIDPTILSQCGTIVAMRLGNATDRAQITSAASDNLAGVLSMLPILRTGEAIILGESVHLPTRTLVSLPLGNRRPSSSDPLIHNEDGPGGWNSPKLRKPDYREVIQVWRKQNPRSPSISTMNKGEEKS